MIALLAAVALAGSWAPSVPLERLEVDGVLILPAATPLQLEVRGDPSQVRVVELDGEPLSVRGVERGLLLPGAATTRELRIERPSSTHIRVRTPDTRHLDTAWERWERETLRALARGEGSQVEPPPGSSERLAAAVRLRAEAVDDPELAQLGALHDTCSLRPVYPGSHRAAEPRQASIYPGNSVTLPAIGPGVLVLRTSPATAESNAPRRVAWTLRVRVDDGDEIVLDDVRYSTTVVGDRLWLPPGAHTLTLDADGPPLDVTATARPYRPLWLGPWPRRPEAPAGPVAALEWQVLAGKPAAAAVAFATAVDHLEGAARELAIARAVAHHPDGAAVRALVTALRPDALSADGVEVVADAVLSRSSLIDPDVVQAWVLAARDPDPAKVAAWLDDLGGTRPRGVALLDLATPDVAADRVPLDAGAAEGTRAARWTRLVPLDREESARTFDLEGPGAPRRLVAAGQTVTVSLGARGPGRTPLLRAFAPEAVDFALDDTSYAWHRAGDLDFALANGEHQLRVERGALVLRADDVLEGGEARYEWRTTRLPATWELPDPGVPLQLMVRAGSARWLVAEFDDGRILEIEPSGPPIPITGGTWATTLRLEGDPDAELAVMAKVRRLAGEDVDLEPVTDIDGVIAEIVAATAAIDAGEGVRPRLERAELLARLGQFTFATRDLAVVDRDGDLRARKIGAEIRAAMRRAAGSAPAEGPWSVEAALAAAGKSDVDPATLTVDDLLRLGTQLEQPFLLVEAATRAVEETPVAAWVMARDAGPPGRDLEVRLRGATRWRTVSRVEASAGLVRAPRPPPPTGEETVWRRAVDAILALPDWGSAVVLREGGRHVVEGDATRLSVVAWCRDLFGPGDPCAVKVRIDDVPSVLEVVDGTTGHLDLPLDAGRHRIELDNPSENHVVQVQTVLDDTAIGRHDTVLAHRATPARPIVVRVFGPTLVRVDVIDGGALVDVDGTKRAAVVGQPVILPVLGEIATVRVAGDALVRLRTGEPEPDLEAWRRGARRPAAATLRQDVAPVFDKLGAPEPERLEPIGGAGTLRVGVEVERRVASRVLAVPFHGATIEAAWMSRDATWWTQLGGWGRVSGVAGGLWAERGLTVGTGRVSGRLEASSDPGIAWRLRARLEGLVDQPVAPALDLRLAARAWVGGVSGLPIEVPDPDVWTRYTANHAVGAEVSTSLRWSPARDVRVDGGGTLRANSDATIDHVELAGGADVLLGPLTVVRATTGMRWMLPDADRSRLLLRPVLRAGIDHAVWIDAARQLSFGASLGWAIPPVGVDFRVRARLLLAARRGLRDLPPDEESFATARGAR